MLGLREGESRSQVSLLPPKGNQLLGVDFAGGGQGDSHGITKGLGFPLWIQPRQISEDSTQECTGHLARQHFDA